MENKIIEETNFKEKKKMFWYSMVLAFTLFTLAIIAMILYSKLETC